MEMLEMMRTRRSIRKYLTTPVERKKLEMIQEAGIFAPNPGGKKRRPNPLGIGQSMMQKKGRQPPSFLKL